MIARAHYDNETLGRFLQDQLHDEEHEISEHVESCDECQSLLETLSQDGLTWDEAGDLLRSDSFDEQSERLQDQSFLQPTDHPNSLGRFGRYEIMEFLGQGGMGIVMRGFDSALNRHSAIKVLSPALASSAAARRRFSREAKSAAAVVHPHVVPIQTVDEYDGLPYLVMPVVEGQSLQQRVDARGPLEVVEVVRIAAQVAEGLAAAHKQGLIHRDIKPANILLENGVERVQITDFGLARAADDASMTRSGVIAGTPQYMSPEQAHGDEIDFRSDLFSLGSVMYFMLTGRSPFRAETTMGVLNRIGNDEPRQLRSINAEIPSWLSAIVNRLLEKNPSNRFASAEAVAKELSSCLTQLQDTTLATAISRSASDRFRPPFLPAAILVAGAALIALLAGIFLIHTDQGTIRIETNGDLKVPIRIRQGDEVVKRLTVNSDGVSTRLRAGTYVIEIEGDNHSLEIKNNQAKVNANDVWVARVELISPGENSESNDDWKSATDPATVYELTRVDTQYARYEQALEKTLWNWDNAVRLQPSWSAVRRSFLLSSWLELGEAYPPALEKMRTIRDELQVRVLSTEQVRVKSDEFADFACINKTLRNDDLTQEVYDKIKARDPKDAERLRYYLPSYKSDAKNSLPARALEASPPKTPHATLDQPEGL